MKKLGKYLDERSLPRLGVLLCFSAVFMLFASPYTTPLNAYYGYDSAVFMSFGKGITHGLRLYLDLYDNKGPMIFYFNALGYLLGGRTGLWILQVVFMTFAFELSYRTARLFTGRGTAWLSVLVLLFLYCGTVGEGNMTEEWSLVFSLLPLWLSLRFIKTGTPAYRHPKWYSVIYGVCFGVNFMMRATNAAIVCGVLLAFAVLLCREKKFGALLLHIVLVLCGAALVVGPFALYFARIGAFDRFMYASFLHNFHYAAGGAAAKTAKDWLMYFARVSMVLRRAPDEKRRPAARQRARTHFLLRVRRGGRRARIQLQALFSYPHPGARAGLRRVRRGRPLHGGRKESGGALVRGGARVLSAALCAAGGRPRR